MNSTLRDRIHHVLSDGYYPSTEQEVVTLVADIEAQLTKSERSLAAQIGVRRTLTAMAHKDRQSGADQYDSATDARNISRLDYAQSWVTIPSNGERVRFCDLTVPQHNERIEHYQVVMRGFADLIDRHAKAIAMIELSGVQTLAQCGKPAKKLAAIA